MMHGPGTEHNKSRPSRRLLCIMFCDDGRAGRLADFILGWHKHAKLRRKGEAGRWSAHSRDDLLAGAGLTLKQYRRAREHLDGAARVVCGGYQGKRALFTQPTEELVRFAAGKYRDMKAARKALAALRQAPGTAPVEPLATTQVGSPGTTQVAPVGTTPGHNQGHNQGHYPIHSAPFTFSHIENQNQEKEKPGKIQQEEQNSESEKSPPIVPPAASDDDACFEGAVKKLQATKAKKDAKLYPEVPIPKGCPLVHPKDKDPKRWASLSDKVKTDLYARFLQYLENWKNGQAGKHAASVYGFGSYGGPGNMMAKLKITIPKKLAELDPEWAAESAALDAELAKNLAALDDLDETA